MRLWRLLWILPALALLLSAGCKKTPDLEEPEEYIPTASDLEEPAAETITGQTRETCLYYCDAAGYIIPVTRTLPWSEGMANAALSYLTAGSEDELQLAARGLLCPLPEGTEATVTVTNQQADIDLRFTGDVCPDAASEKVMLAAVVNTLLEFSTIDRVAVTVDGAGEALPLGTPLEAVYTQPLLNTEPAGVPEGSEGKALLYFTDQTGTYLVPVWRAADTGTLTPAELVGQLLLPGENTPLVSLFPPACKVISADIDQEGRAVINFSREFESMASMAGMEQTAIRGLMLTLEAYDEITALQIQVEGEAYEVSESTLAHQTWLNYYK